MSDVMNMNPCVDTEKPESVKLILEDIDMILKELGNELVMIDSAIYSPSTDGSDANEPQYECILGTLNRQRNKAESLLKLAVHIREGLW